MMDYRTNMPLHNLSVAAAEQYEHPESCAAAIGRVYACGGANLAAWRTTTKMQRSPIAWWAFGCMMAGISLDEAIATAVQAIAEASHR